MVSKRWQKKHAIIQHSTLAIVWGGPLFLFQYSWPNWVKLTLVILIWVIGIRLAVFLNNHFANSMVRVFRFEHDIAVGIVQQVVRDNYFRYKRQIDGDAVRYNFQEQVLTLTIEPYPLNLPIDDHIEVSQASKVVLNGLNQTNQAFAEKLSVAINETAASRLSRRNIV